MIPELDMDEVRRFADERGVRLWLWLHWTDVDRTVANKDIAYKKAFPLYEKWGIAGVKIDFMDRDDQEMVNWYEKITAAAAEHKLMVNFHGAFKTSGFDRTYPNQVTREGILGNEYNKWSDRVTPEHKLTLPFTRYLEGPADFTPGGFLNRQPGQFKTNVKPTQVQGTRAAELALFVCYDSPVCCVCDHPDHLRDQPGADFLKIVPTVWDETRVLDGAVGEHLVMVRQSGDDWYLGAMTNREPREIPVKLDFLDGGRWKLKLWQDADDSGENAEHLDRRRANCRAGRHDHAEARSRRRLRGAIRTRVNGVGVGGHAESSAINRCPRTFSDAHRLPHAGPSRAGSRVHPPAQSDLAGARSDSSKSTACATIRSSSTAQPATSSPTPRSKTWPAGRRSPAPTSAASGGPRWPR